MQDFVQNNHIFNVSLMLFLIALGSIYMSLDMMSITTKPILKSLRYMESIYT